MAKKNNNYIPKKNNYSHSSTGFSSGEKSMYTNKKRKKPKRLGNTCVYFNETKLTCKKYGQFCTDADQCVIYESKDKITQSKIDNYMSNRKSKEQLSEVGVTAVVLNDNRKCANLNHNIQDIVAILRISVPSGQIIDYEISAAFCDICNTYFMLKNDFKEAKKVGIILCPIEDRTQKYISKINKKIRIAANQKFINLDTM